ncbi:bifunctional riboflavin kinase/FAD synthetase [Anaerobaca lacustris]|uniref:Riboflavin biosynthesis protein n=1 Tax=Anaerobaca lacustris TaxID=3044600 RepID=A0AAW6TP81_9BACT|nr:bifunctional riboflavin kinase/FAD synthetase [Sedimentisphaerales bacterium M17dextr]
MKVLKSLSEFGRIRKGCVLTIGNFDGVHVGHREILRTARALAADHSAEMVVMTFEPHPVAILHPEKAPGVLTPLPLKLDLLGEYADNCVIVLQDNRKLLELSPEDFVDQFLVAGFAPRFIVEGHDFHFGSGRAGDIETLIRLGREKGFEVVVVEPRQMTLPMGETIRVSSTVIRYMVESGHVGDAAVALSRPYRLLGPIVSGRGRGRELGFPTLNMAVPNQVIPAEGVYAGFVEIADDPESLPSRTERCSAVFSIGQIRTFEEKHPLLIEAHVLDERLGDVTGRWMVMEFVQHLRHQHKFGSPEDLAAQIARDCDQARTALEQFVEGEAP